MSRHYYIEDKEICIHSGTFRLDTDGRTFQELLDNATIVEMNEDSEEVASYDFGGAPGDIQAKVEKFITEFLANA